MRRSARRLALLVPPALLLLVIYHPLFQGKVLAARDLFRLFIPTGAFTLECLQRGELPLWIPYERLGQPFLATLQTRVFSPPALISLLLFGPVRGPTVELLILAIIGAWGCARISRTLGASRIGAMVSGCAFGLGPLLTQLSDQLHTIAAMAWSGFIADSAYRLGRNPSPRRAAALALFLALSLVAGSPETTLWQCLFAVVVAVAAAPRPQRLAASGVSIGAILWSGALAAAALLPAAEFALHSTRTAAIEGQLEWSAPPITLLSAAWLNADLPRAGYWGTGDQGLIPSAFLGSLICILAIGGAARRRARAVLVCGIVCALLSLGSHFLLASALLQLPPLSLFRYPAKYLLGFAFAVCVLAGPGLDWWIALAERLRPRRIGAIGVILIAIAIAASSASITRGLSMRGGAAGGLAWAVCFIGAAALAILLARPGTPQARLGLATIALLEIFAAQALLSQVVWVPARTLSEPSPYAARLRELGGRISARADAGAPARASVAEIESSRARLVKLRFIEEKLAAVEGYSALEPERIDEITGDASAAVLASLGVRWIISETGPIAGARLAMSQPGLPSVYEVASLRPRTFIVHRARVGSDGDAAELLKRADARNEVILEDGVVSTEQPRGPCASTARIVRERSGFVEIEAKACAAGYLVLMDSWFPGWRAAVDTTPAAIHRANLVGRAVAISGGSHLVTFTYRPWSFTGGCIVSLLALAALLFARFRRRANLLSSADHGH